MDLYKQTSLNPETLAEIRRLHFQTRHLVDQGIAGQYRSAFKGRGIEFEEVREYFPGDDVRAIDWKVTARSQKPYIKSYREERELTVMIAVDVSASTRTGTRSQIREALIAKVSAALTLIALNNNDKVGLVTFSDQLETYHPPRKARSAVWRILHEVLTTGAYRPKTNLNALFSFLSKVLKRSAIIFVVSDFFDSDYESSLAVLSKRHDVTFVTIRDPMDQKLVRAGMIRILDPETGEALLLDTSTRSLRERYQTLSAQTRESQKKIHQRHRVGEIILESDISFIDKLSRYFNTRMTMSPRRK